MKKTIEKLIAIFCVALVLCSSRTFASFYEKYDGTPFEKACRMLRELCWETDKNGSLDINRYKYMDANSRKKYAYSLTLPFDCNDFYDDNSRNQGYFVVDSKGNYYFQEIESTSSPRIKNSIPVKITVDWYYCFSNYSGRFRWR